LGVAPPVAGSAGNNAVGTNDVGRGRRFGARRARSEEGGAGSHSQAQAQAGSDGATRRQVGGGMFRKGDENV
jgi:hypothetical protein